LWDNFRLETDPDDPRWIIWELRDTGRFNAVLGPMRARVQDGKAIVRIVPSRQHSNFLDYVHGGLMMGFIDCALFAAARILECRGADEAVTLECSTQFLAVGKLDIPLDAVIEVLRETGRFIFQRGIVEQEGEAIASFTGILRKAGKPHT
jgi:uncharacterized protein (TIGR00369 family)